MLPPGGVSYLTGDEVTIGTPEVYSGVLVFWCFGEGVFHCPASVYHGRATLYYCAYYTVAYSTKLNAFYVNVSTPIPRPPPPTSQPVNP